MKSSWILCAVLLLTGTGAWAAGSGGMGGGMTGGDAGSGGGGTSPRELARTAHNDGLKFKRRALRMEEEAASASSETARTEAAAEALDNWAKAIAAFRTAIELDSKNYKSLNELGYALRKTGQYQIALAAYASALAMKPDFGEAIEYRAEAHLNLGQLDEVKAAYMRLVQLDDDLAATLLVALQAWSTAHAQDAAESVVQFRAWIAERAALANFVGGTARDWRA